VDPRASAETLVSIIALLQQAVRLQPDRNAPLVMLADSYYTASKLMRDADDRATIQQLAVAVGWQWQTLGTAWPSIRRALWTLAGGEKRTERIMASFLADLNLGFAEYVIGPDLYKMTQEESFDAVETLRQPAHRTHNGHALDPAIIPTLRQMLGLDPSSGSPQSTHVD
jgi:hypothetical protein